MVEYQKTIAERYEFRHKHSLFIITISTEGDLNIQGDYGKYSYSWRSFGEDFKKFLIRIDSSYLLDKLSDRTYFNYWDWMKSTVEKVRTDKLYCYTKEEQEVLVKELNEIGEESNYDVLLCKLASNYVISTIEPDIWECYWLPEKTYPINAVEFCKVIFPIFKEIMKSEIEKENKQ